MGSGIWGPYGDGGMGKDVVYGFFIGWILFAVICCFYGGERGIKAAIFMITILIVWVLCGLFVAWFDKRFGGE